MRPTLPIIFATLLRTASADFLISNTTVCMGSFIIHKCIYGAKVLSGIDKKKDYTCPRLITAQDNHYIHNGTAGPFGGDRLLVENGICDSGKLKLAWNNETMHYEVNDESDQKIGDCHWDNGTSTSCHQWVGMLFFNSMYRCTGACD